MEAIIRELGALKEADIELKPLTIFIGENSTGKTWTAYLLSAILSNYGLKRYFNAYIKDKEHLHSYHAIDNIIEKFLEEGNAKLDVIQFFNDFGESYFNDVASLAKDWMKSFMATKENPFENLSINLKLEHKEQIMRALLDYSIDDSSASVYKDKGLRAVKEKGQNFLYFYTEDPDIKEKMPLKSIKAYITKTIFAIMHISLYPGVFFFPVERTFFGSITIMKRMQDDENNFDKFRSKKGFLIKTHIPLSDFIDTMIEIEQSGNIDNRLKEADSENNIAKYLELADILEKKVLDGKMEFSNRGQNLSRELVFKQVTNDKAIALDMPIVSSTVKELSPLVVFLRYEARSRTLIVIDEPEMNLHPKAQAKIIEFLAMLVNSGLRVLITTHSPYIVDHLVNLIKASEHADKEKIKDLFALKSSDAFISKEDVSVYNFAENTAKSILDNNGFINWDTFSEISEWTEQLYFEL